MEAQVKALQTSPERHFDWPEAMGRSLREYAMVCAVLGGLFAGAEAQAQPAAALRAADPVTSVEETNKPASDPREQVARPPTFAVLPDRITLPVPEESKSRFPER